MPISFDIEEIREKNDCKIYFETGMWDPRMNISAKKALRCRFDRVYTIELCREWIYFGEQIFKEELESGRLKMMLGDSNHLKDIIMNDESIQKDLREKTMFFFDAHVDNAMIYNAKNQCPLMNEMDVLFSLERKDHVLLFDDVRILKNPRPWGEWGYGEMIFLDEIIKKIHELNPEYVIEYLNGYTENDVLYAYVPLKEI